MKHKKICTLILSGLLLLSGCAEKRDTDADDTQTTTTTAATTTAATTTTAAATTSADTTTAETTKETKVTGELVMPDDGNGYPDKLYVDYFIDDRAAFLAEDIKAQRDAFSQSNEFIDFKFIPDPEPSVIPEDVQKLAVECVMNYYDSEADDLSEYADEFSKDGNLSHFVSDGKVIPEFYNGWEYDFEGNGKTERYMIVEIPVGDYVGGKFKSGVGSFLIFEDSNGEISRVGYADYRPYQSDCKDIILLDYGKFKQLIFGGWGKMGILDNNAIHGVIDGKDVILFSGRQWFYKRGCFLSYSGHQGVSGVMVFDANENDYRGIYGYPADLNKLKALDPDGAISVPPEEDEDSKYFHYFVIGEKYVLNGHYYDCCKYEDGKFTNLGTFGGIAIYPLLRRVDDTDVPFDIDLDYALAASGTTLD